MVSMHVTNSVTFVILHIHIILNPFTDYMTDATKDYFEHLSHSVSGKSNGKSLLHVMSSKQYTDVHSKLWLIFVRTVMIWICISFTDMLVIALYLINYLNPRNLDVFNLQDIHSWNDQTKQRTFVALSPYLHWGRYFFLILALYHTASMQLIAHAYPDDNADCVKCMHWCVLMNYNHRQPSETFNLPCLYRKLHDYCLPKHSSTESKLCFSSYLLYNPINHLGLLYFSNTKVYNVSLSWSGLKSKNGRN